MATTYFIVPLNLPNTISIIQCLSIFPFLISNINYKNEENFCTDKSIQKTLLHSMDVVLGVIKTKNVPPFFVLIRFNCLVYNFFSRKDDVRVGKSIATAWNTYVIFYPNQNHLDASVRCTCTARRIHVLWVILQIPV